MDKVVLTQLTVQEIRQLLQEELQKFFLQQNDPEQISEPSDQWFDIDQLRNYLPGKPARSTIYANINNIPHKKMGGKRLAFLKSEIDSWLMGQSRKTISDIEKEAEEMLTSK